MRLLERALSAAQGEAQRGRIEESLRKAKEQAALAAQQLQRMAVPSGLGERLKGLASGSVGDAVKASLASLGGSRMGQAATAVAGGTGQAASAAMGAGAAALGAVGAAAAGVTAAFNLLVNSAGVLQQSLSPFTQLVQQFDPGVAQRFMMALEDLQASLGQAFVPLVQVGAQVADMLNSVFTQLAPAILPVVGMVSEALRDLAGSYLSALRPVLAATVPLLALFAEQLKPLGETFGQTVQQMGGLVTDVLGALLPLAQSVIPALTTGLRTFYSVVNEVIVHLRAGLAVLKHMIDTWNEAGAWSPERLQRVFDNALQSARRPLPQIEANAARTFAARPASVVGIEDIGRNARLAAFGSRGAAERTADDVGFIRRWLEGRPNGRDQGDSAREGIQNR